jgi:hypothetical protein
VTTELIILEEQGWQALSSTPEAAGEFYDRILDETVVMLLPGGLRLDNRTTILAAMSGQPWSTYELQDPSVVTLGPDAGVVVYGVVARRAGAAAYSALISSTYVRRRDGWKLTVHQQTPR